MAHPAYIREKAIQMRVERRLSIDEIAERLALPKTTIYYWVKGIPLQRPRRNVPGRGANAMTRKHRALREAAYDEGRGISDIVLFDQSLRDFVTLYIAEGYKRSRNDVSICNSDPVIVKLAAHWLRRLSNNKIDYSVQYHADQNPNDLRAFWSAQLDIAPDQIRCQPKTNSGQLAKRIWRCRYGVFMVRVGDTYLRSRLEAWMDVLRDGWDLDLAA